MNVEDTADLSLLSWNILAPCLVFPDWYPTLYKIAANHTYRIEKVMNTILSLKHDVIFIQEAEECVVSLLKLKLSNIYSFHTTWNNPPVECEASGLLILIRKKWTYASTVTIINGILDSEKGEAIQIMTIPSKNIHLVNLHLNYMDPISQAKMVMKKCNELLNTSNIVTILAGDMNAEKEVNNEFDRNGFIDVFNQLNDEITIPTYYPDPAYGKPNTAIDHIFYNPYRIELIDYGKAWRKTNASLTDALTTFGSDHIYVWATFKFRS